MLRVLLSTSSDTGIVDDLELVTGRGMRTIARHLQLNIEQGANVLYNGAEPSPTAMAALCTVSLAITDGDSRAVDARFAQLARVLDLRAARTWAHVRRAATCPSHLPDVRPTSSRATHTAAAAAVNVPTEVKLDEPCMPGRRPLEAQHIPQLLQEPVAAAIFRSSYTWMQWRTLRRYGSLYLLRHIAGCTWEEAAKVLAFPVEPATVTGWRTRARSLLTTREDLAEVHERLDQHALAADLNDLVDYAERRRALAGFTTIADDHVDELLAAVRSGRRGRRPSRTHFANNAARSIWVTLTCGDATFAPGPPMHDRDISLYWAFERHLPDAAREALLEYGTSMLHK